MKYTKYISPLFSSSIILENLSCINIVSIIYLELKQILKIITHY